MRPRNPHKVQYPSGFMQLILTAIFLFCIGLSAQAQIIVRGSVKGDDDDAGIDNVKVRVYHGSKTVRLLRTNGDGTFKFELVEGMEYLVEFSKNYFVTIRLTIDANVPEEAFATNDFNVELNVPFFVSLEGLDLPFLEPSFALINYQESQNDLFWDDQPEVIRRTELLRAEIARLRNSGASRVKYKASSGMNTAKKENVGEDSVVEEPKEQQMTSSYEQKLARAEKAEQSQAVDSARRETAGTENRILKLAANAERDTRKASTQQRQLKFDEGMEERRRREELARQRRMEMKEEEALREVEKNKNLEVKRKNINDIVAIAAEERKKNEQKGVDKDTTIISDVRPVIQYDTLEGMISITYRVSIKFPGRTEVYDKVVYNWLLFDLHYYYKNNNEIEEEEYNETVEKYKN